MKMRTGAKEKRWQDNPLLTLLPVRLAALRASSACQAAEARHRAFSDRTATYREAVESHGDGTAAMDTSEIGGLRWTVPASDRAADGFAERVLEHGWLPVKEIADGRRVAVGGVMLDIGANIGTTCIPRVVLGDFQYVYAAEPEPANYTALVRNVVDNGLQGFVMPERLALAASDGEATLGVHRGIATHALVASGQTAKRHGVAVPTRTLDTWIDSLDLNIADVTFIKTDCQGWEGHILAGAERTLVRKHIVWQIEFWPKGIDKSGFSMHDVYRILDESFEYFIDIRRGEARQLPISKLRSSLSYFNAKPNTFTELILFNGAMG